MPPSPPTRVGSTRTWCGGRGCRPAAVLGVVRRRLARPRPGSRALRDDELDLDAVADDPGQRLADQRAIARLEPVLGEAVRDGDPEALLVDVDQLRVAQPRLVVGRRERDLQLAESRSPDLLRVHSFDGTCDGGGRWMGSVDQGPVIGAGVTRAISKWPTAAPGRCVPGDPVRGLPGAPAGVPAPRARRG